MTRRLLLPICALALVAMVTSFVACSGDDTQLHNPLGTSSNLELYFPITANSSQTYEVTSADSTVSTVVRSIGDATMLNNQQAFFWISQTDTMTPDTSWLVRTWNEIRHIENEHAAPERLLTLPLTVGTTWDRFADSVFLSGAVGASSLLAGTSQMTVDAIEHRSLNDGTEFQNCVRISNAGAYGYNYCWFAPHVGLVRWVFGSQDDGETGQQVGELQ